MKKIAIIHYNLNKKGGSQTVAVNLANELSAFYHVSLISIRGSISNDFAVDDKVNCLCSGGSNRLMDGINLNKALKSNCIDVALFIGTGGCYCMPVISKGIRMIVSEQSNVMNAVYMKRFKTRLNHIIAAIWADRIICLTEQDRRAWIDKYHLPDDCVDVIHNYFVPKEVKECERKNQVITIGSFDPVKGYEYLIDVASKVLPVCDYTWHVYAVGDNDYKYKIIDMAKGMEGLVFEEPRADLTDVYNEAKINVMTSRNEGLPLSLIEAKLYGCVNVAFDCVTGPSEIIRHETDGYLVKCFDTIKMAERILELVNSEETLKQYSENARNDYERFSKDKVIEKWAQVIEG